MTLSELKPLATSVNDAVVQISYRWKIFLELYDSGDESIAAMNRRGSNVFQLLQKLIIDDVTLSLSRLTDRATTGKQVNISLPYLLENSLSHLKPEDAQRLRSWVSQLISDVATIREHRNKFLAHADLGVVAAPDSLRRLTYDELEKAMEACRTILTDLVACLFSWSTHYDVLIPYGCDGTTLIHVLKAGNHVLDAA